MVNEGIGSGDSDPINQENLLNEKELDYLFDEVDWTGDMQLLEMTPEKLREHVSNHS